MLSNWGGYRQKYFDRMALARIDRDQQLANLIIFVDHLSTSLRKGTFSWFKKQKMIIIICPRVPMVAGIIWKDSSFIIFLAQVLQIERWS